MVQTRPDSMQSDALADFICDYIDGLMDPVVVLIFEEYMSNHPKLAEFVREANLGKNALMKLKDASSELNAQ
jgi:hypothetical protein